MSRHFGAINILLGGMNTYFVIRYLQSGQRTWAVLGSIIAIYNFMAGYTMLVDKEIS